MADLKGNSHRSREVEMSELEEVQVLIPEAPRPVKAESKARAAAYRAEMQHKRSLLLILMIVPVILIIVAWNVFDSNAEIGESSSSGYANGPITHA